MHGPNTRFHENPLANFGDHFVLQVYAQMYVYPLTPACSNQHGDRAEHDPGCTVPDLSPLSARRKSQEVAKERNEYISELAQCRFHPSASLTCTVLSTYGDQ